MLTSLKQNAKPICLMLLCAVSISVAQMLWKLPEDFDLRYMAAGVAIYGLGALCMIFALRLGELSMLQPINSMCMVIALFIGYYVFDDVITVTHVAGVITIMAGIVLLGASGEKVRK